MPFEKNVSGNPKGKPKGAVNKTTRELREIINEFLSKNLDKIQDDFDKLEPKEKLLFIDKMLKHILPPKVEEVEGEQRLAITFYQTLQWNFRVRGKYLSPEFSLVISRETATVAESFAPHVEGLPFTDANARSPIPTLTSAFVERGIMAEVGPTVKSSATMFV